MIIDFLAPDQPKNLDVDLCIVGSGAAGLSIARSFFGSRIRVCVLESGGLVGEDRSQFLNSGTSVGEAYIDPATSRMRAFGGTCNVWGCGCIPLARQDFEPRSWIPESGWPISYDDLKPYYARAQRFCGIDAHEFEDGSCTAPSSLTAIEFDHDGDLINRFCAQSPFRFGQVYRDDMARAGNVTVLLHANVLELVPCHDGTRVQEARVAGLDGRRGVVTARHFVLACGAIENARLMLLSHSQSASGLGNSRDLVGRYFMEHPTVKLGDLWGAHADSLTRSYARIAGDRVAPTFPEISLADASQREHRMLNCRVRPVAVESQVPRGVKAIREFRAVDETHLSEDASIRRRIDTAQWPHPSPSKSSTHIPRLLTEVSLGAGAIAHAMARKLAGLPTIKTDHVELLGFFEQAPNRESRVTLGRDTDQFGQRKVEIDWRLTDLDWHTYRSAARVFGENLAKHCDGGFLPQPWLCRDGPGEPHHVRSAAHHIGTTRMSASPTTGVVDPDCRVHGIDNLYVAGSSVFPTGGWAFPTLTIVALGLRLADHLRERIGQKIQIREAARAQPSRALAELERAPQ